MSRVCKRSKAISHAQQGRGSAVDGNASLLAGPATRCIRWLARRVSAGTISGWKDAALLARRAASAPTEEITRRAKE